MFEINTEQAEWIEVVRGPATSLYAYRKAHALWLTGLVTPPDDGPMRLELRPYVRASRMEFLQDFLLGQPTEHNGQESLGLMTTLVRDTAGGFLAAGIDLEYADSFLLEDQERVEYVKYDYDNRMLAGNTDENGVACLPDGCLYSRPADRNDSFDDLVQKLALSYDLSERLTAYVAASRGFRPPETTELYRLQRTQDVADLDSERLDAIEVGLKGEFEAARFSLAAFDMDKRNVMREANGFNVSNGRTSHESVEYEFVWQATHSLALTAAGTFARHRCEFSRAVEGGETITSGNDVDTAPRELHTARLDWQPTERVSAEAEWLMVGDYWLDAANAHRYSGHDLVNLRGRYDFAPGWSFATRVNNVFDRDYADRADFAFGNFRYFPGRDRTLFVELSWQR